MKPQDTDCQVWVLCIQGREQSNRQHHEENQDRGRLYCERSLCDVVAFVGPHVEEEHQICGAIGQ